MKNPLIDRLRALPPSSWTPEPPASEAEIAELETSYGLQLPADHRELLLYSNGGTLVEAIQCHLLSVEEMHAQNADEVLEERVPELFAFGDDGAGSLYFYDRTGGLGRGAYAVYLLPLGRLKPASAWFCGATFGEMIAAVLAGKNFRDGDTLGAS